MTDERLRRDVWTEMLSADRTVRYYGQTATRLGRIATVLLTTSVVAGSSGAGAFLESIMGSGANKTTVWLIVVAVVAGCLNWTFKFSENAAKAEKVRLECDLILSKWKALWEEVNSPGWEAVPRETVKDQMAALRKEMTMATAEGTRFAGEGWLNKGLNQQCAAEAYEAMSNAYPGFLTKGVE